MEFLDGTLVESFRAAWNAHVSMESCLSKLVIAANGRAAGCWRLEDGFLNLMGFCCAIDMPEEVDQGFRTATQRVSLDQTGLGIVKAAVSKSPAIGRRDANATGLIGSASWIEKFGATTSLAVPIFQANSMNVAGVVAVSTAAIIKECDPLWQSLLHLSQKLSQTDNR